jgi:hypothetical protein
MMASSDRQIATNQRMLQEHGPADDDDYRSFEASLRVAQRAGDPPHPTRLGGPATGAHLYEESGALAAAPALFQSGRML